MSDYWKEWVLDITHHAEDAPVFCPYERETANVLIGMMLIQPKSPGKLVGVFHMDGQEYVDTFCNLNPDWQEKYSS